MKPKPKKTNIIQEVSNQEVSNQLIRSTTYYSGNLPPPQMMVEYNKIDPTFANRIITMAENEQIHEHKLQNKLLFRNYTLRIFGLLCAIITFLILSYLSYLSILRDNTMIAVSIIGIIVASISVFVYRSVK